MNLNLGSGSMIFEDYINLDKLPFIGVNIISDLELGIPFKDNSFGQVYAKDSLEHIKNIVNLFGEIHRILKPSGILTFVVPYYTALSAFQSLDHKTFFTHNTMIHFVDHAKGGGWDLGTDFLFEGIESKFNYYEGTEEICQKLGITIEEGIKHLNNIVDTMEIKVKAIK